MKGKKADISIQFNWIFVLIAGMVLLAFFVGFALWQSQRAEDARNLKKSQFLEAGLLNAEQSALNSEDVVRSLKIAQTTLRASCDEVSELRIKDSDFFIDTANSVVFSRAELEAGELFLWVSNWESPFKTAPFVFMDDGSKMYVFVKNPAKTGESEKLFHDFLYNSSKLPVDDPEGFKDKGFGNYIFIFLGEQQNSIESLIIDSSVKKFSAVNLLPSDYSSFEGHGIIEFYSQNGGRLELAEKNPFLLKESVFGAIFADNAGFYECSMEKAVERLGWLSAIHKAKAEKLEQEYQKTNSPCSSLYFIPKNYLSRIGSTVFSEASFSQTFDSIADLDKFNKDLTEVHKCAPIY